ncbi:unnamed protein product [Owenia fusiformis]|uniref:HECT-type E3 ubiquitin transferase n=1 Tax=Owenia fusiformis TaxID=6347 RepID=A0A8J1U145_OWEFU|nr:unnamed protein product [Owenia fusiformis]
MTEFSPTGIKLRRFLLIFFICGISWFVYKRHVTHQEQRSNLLEWLRENGLTNIATTVLNTGVHSVEELANKASTDYEFRIQALNKEAEERIEEGINKARDYLQFKHWLTDNQLGQFLDKLKRLKVQSLHQLCNTEGVILKELLEDASLAENYEDFYTALDQLRADTSQCTPPYSQYTYKTGDNSLLSLVYFSSITFTLATMVYVATTTVMSWRQGNPGSGTNSKYKTSSILEYVMGNYLEPKKCKVHWEWEEPQTVGKTMTFQIKFFQKNGRAYPISDADNLVVEIMNMNNRMTASVQHGSSKSAEANTSHVMFTVHKSGEYKISIMVGATHIKGSPFIKEFDPGPIDASKTRIANHSSVIVCTQGQDRPLVIEPRDQYGNLCKYVVDSAEHHFNVSITEPNSGATTCHNGRLVYESSTKHITMQLKLSDEGCYKAVATYKNTKLHNGEFSILVLNENDSNLVKKNTAKKSHNIWYEGRLLSSNNEKLSKAKKVFCYISPKQLTIKEFYLKIIPKRLFTFRVCPSTKFLFKGYSNHYDAPVLTIDDGAQPPLELATKDRGIIAATFTNFLLKNIGGSETFKDKQDFFYHEVRQLHRRRDTKLYVQVQRANILESSMKASKNWSTSDWCRNFEVTFQGEAGLDWGGVRREWFELVCSELFDPSSSGLFTRFTEDNQGLVHPNHKRVNYSKLKYYEFAGKVVGKCLYESSLGGSYRQNVKAKFTRSFLAQIIGLRVSYRYFEQDDPSFYMSKIKYIEENDITDMELLFTEDEYDNAGKLEQVIELKPGGAKTKVTNKNKLKYLDKLAQHRLANCIKDEMEAFLKGLNDLIPDNLLGIFDENELELLMCGTGSYSVADLKQFHTVTTHTQEFTQVLKWFWTIVSGFTQEEMARLLQFTTGCSQLPPGGFAELNPHFTISPSPMYGVLPTAHTCFNQLCLPDYDSIDHFHQSLVIAINEGNTGFGMV